MSLLYVIGITVGVVGTFVTALFLLSIAIKRNDVADIAWGPGIALASFTAWIAAGLPANPVVIAVLILTLIWAIRIGVRIFLKNYRKPEDPRYRLWREEWGKWFYLRSYLQVFLLQGALMVVLAASAISVVASDIDEVSMIWLILGVGIWIIGFCFEAIADYQLDRFISKKENRGKIMRYGLWRYSRHPNYFGEVTMWWGIWMLVATHGFGLLALLSPVTITILILYVSGIPLLEASMKKYDEWPEYEKSTSVFFPWPPKD